DVHPKVMLVDRDRVPVVERLLNEHSTRSVMQSIAVVVTGVGHRLPSTFHSFDQLVTRFASDRVGPQVPHFVIGADSTMLLVHTSGSTGLPKGACHSHRSM